MQIIGNYNYNINLWKSNRNNSVNFKAGELKEITSPELIKKLNNALKSEVDIMWLEGSYHYINDLSVPAVLQKIDLSVTDFWLDMVKIPSKHLPELLGEKGNVYNLPRLQGLCIFASNDASLEQSNIYNMQVVLVPNSISEDILSESYREMLSQKNLRSEYLTWL